MSVYDLQPGDLVTTKEDVRESLRNGTGIKGSFLYTFLEARPDLDAILVEFYTYAPSRDFFLDANDVIVVTW